MTEPRRTFGPVVGLGLASGVLAAVASAKPWVAAEGDTPSSLPGLPAIGAQSGAGEMPVAFALALVVLAAWGVVLVTRGRVRRAVAVLAAVAAAGVVVAVVVAWSTLPDQLRDSLTVLGDAGEPEIGRTGWYWAAAAGAVGSLVATVLAVRFAPAWPEMGARYDAPAGGAAAPAPGEEPSNLDLWRAIDEGHDPTER